MFANYLHDALYALREHALRLEQNTADDLAQVADGYTLSTRNLVHYLAIRQHDIRELQKDMSQIGLSSLNVLEPHVIASLDAGVPSRGEVTDAAMSCQAECVMLNKGPYMSETIRFLGDVSQRMSQHRVKRVATLRRLSVADAYQLP